MFQRLILPILVLFSLISIRAEADPPPTLEDILVQVVRPVIAGRAGYFEYEIQQAPQPRLIVRSRYEPSTGKQFVVGKYAIQFGPIEKQTLVVKETVQHGIDVRQVIGTQQLEIDRLTPETIELHQGAIRSLLRADPLLHPQITPMVPGAQSEPSVPQLEVLRELEELRRESARTHQPLAALIFMPTGHGKTFAAMEWARREGQRLATAQNTSSNEARFSRVVFVVQDLQLLKDAGDKFRDYLSLKEREQVFIQPNDNDASTLAKSFTNPNVRAWFITRSMAYGQRDRLANLMKRPEPVIFVFDEAHHLGRAAVEAGVAETEDAIDEKSRGQFRELLNTIEPQMRAQDQKIGMTATPWHKESDILAFFHQNLIAAHLTKDERNTFVRNGDSMSMARLGTLRAMAAGYLSPIHEYRQILYLGNKMSASQFLNSARMSQVISLNRSSQSAELQKETTVHVPFLQTMLDDIADRTRHLETESLTPARGMIFVSSTSLADFYASEIQKLANAGRIHVEFRAYHSDMPRDKRTDTVKWLKAETGRHQHRYVFVVRSLTEGFDARAINHLIFSKSYNEDNRIGFRELMQNLGRGTRPAPYKTRTYITDFSGRLYDLVFKDMDPVVMRRAVLRRYTPNGNEITRVVVSGSPPANSFLTNEVDTQVPNELGEASGKIAAAAETKSELTPSQIYRMKFWSPQTAAEAGSLGVEGLRAELMPADGWTPAAADAFIARALGRFRSAETTQLLDQLKVSPENTISEVAAKIAQAKSPRANISALENTISAISRSHAKTSAATLMLLPLSKWPENLLPALHYREHESWKEMLATAESVWKIPTLADFYIQLDHQMVFDRLSELERSPEPRHQALVRSFDRKPTLVRALTIIFLSRQNPKRNQTPLQIRAFAERTEWIVSELVRRVVMLRLPTAGRFVRESIVRSNASGQTELAIDASASAASETTVRILLGRTLQKQNPPPSLSVPDTTLDSNVREFVISNPEKYMQLRGSDLSGRSLEPSSDIWERRVNLKTDQPFSIRELAQKGDLYFGFLSHAVGAVHPSDLLFSPFEKWPKELAGAVDKSILLGYSIFEQTLGIRTAAELYLFLDEKNLEQRVRQMLESPTAELAALLSSRTELRPPKSGFQSKDEALATALTLLSFQSNRSSGAANDWEFNFRLKTAVKIVGLLRVLRLSEDSSIDRAAFVDKVRVLAENPKPAKNRSNKPMPIAGTLADHIGPKWISAEFFGYEEQSFELLRNATRADAARFAASHQLTESVTLASWEFGVLQFQHWRNGSFDAARAIRLPNFRHENALVAPERASGFASNFVTVSDFQRYVENLDSKPMNVDKNRRMLELFTKRGEDRSLLRYFLSDLETLPLYQGLIDERADIEWIKNDPFLKQLRIASLADFWAYLSRDSVLSDLDRLESDKSDRGRRLVEFLHSRKSIRLADVFTALAMRRLWHREFSNSAELAEISARIQLLVDGLVFVRASGIVMPLANLPPGHADNRTYRMQIASQWTKSYFESSNLIGYSTRIMQNREEGFRKAMPIRTCEQLFNSMQ